jgi:hypothetical protein
VHQLTPYTPTGYACGCIPAIPPDPEHLADALQALAIARSMAGLGLAKRSYAVAFDPAAGAAVLRVETVRGLYSLIIPPVGRPFPVWHNGARNGALDARRVPGNRDSYIGALFAAYLRDRAALSFPVDPRDDD